MLDTDNTPPKRRLTDKCDVCSQIEKAFVKNDLGEPDFDGHRRAHLQLIEADKIMNGYKNEATKKVIGWVVAILLGAMSSGFVMWMKDHLK